MSQKRRRGVGNIYQEEEEEEETSFRTVVFAFSSSKSRVLESRVQPVFRAFISRATPSILLSLYFLFFPPLLDVSLSNEPFASN